MYQQNIPIALLIAGLLAACSAAPPPVAPTALVLPSPVVTVLPTSVPTAIPTATPIPPTAAPTATSVPTAIPPTITPTPNPWAAYEQYTIEGMRAKAFSAEGEIEFVEVLERGERFTRHLIAYQNDGLRITGMLNMPRGDGPFPVVILAHGYYPLDVYRTGNGTRVAADYLANRGFLTISPDFRSHAGSDDAPNVFRAGHVLDTLALIPLAQRLPQAQPGPVGLWGHSNGGAIMAKVMAISDQIAATVIYAPASLTIAEDYAFRLERSSRRAGQAPGRRTGVIDLLAIEFPVLPAEAPELYQRLSPLPYLADVQAPVQIHWGDADEVVPYKWPGDLLAGLQQAGKPVAYYEYAGQPHSFTGQANQLYLQRIAEFYTLHLGSER
jgi:uncharacterized protein